MSIIRYTQKNLSTTYDWLSLKGIRRKCIKKMNNRGNLVRTFCYIFLILHLQLINR